MGCACGALRRGSIPANAGETPTTPGWLRGCRVYPRERGGDCGVSARKSSCSGLSPRTRGRRGRAHRGVAGRGFIPANAGETCWRWRSSRLPRVYPRERGGDCSISGEVDSDEGLSPRTRGRRAAGPDRDADGRSIPANAGETRPAGGNRRATGVYPRERGGDVISTPITVRMPGLSPRTRGRQPHHA